MGNEARDAIFGGLHVKESLIFLADFFFLFMAAPVACEISQARG